jgi:hypothetical protein
MRSIRAKKSAHTASLPTNPVLTKSTAMKDHAMLEQSSKDLHLLGDVIETLKRDLAKLKAKNAKLVDRQRKTESWALDLERRAIKAESVLNTVHKVFKSTANSTLSAQMQSTKRILEKLMAVTERESKKDPLIKAQLAASKASGGLNRINELEAENAAYKRKQNELYKAIAAGQKKMQGMKPRKTENERLAELLAGNFDIDEHDGDEADAEEQSTAMDAVHAVRQAAYEASIKTTRCESCGSNYLVDGSSAKNNGIETIIRQGGDSFLKNKQDLLLAKAQLKAFKINLKHLRRENGRFRSAIEYLKAKLAMNDVGYDVTQDFGEVLGGAGIGLATSGHGGGIDTAGSSSSSGGGGGSMNIHNTASFGYGGLHIDIDDVDPIVGMGSPGGFSMTGNGNLRFQGEVSRHIPHAPFYPTASSLEQHDPLAFVPYEVDATDGLAPMSSSPSSPNRGGSGGYGLPMSDDEKYYMQELQRSPSSPTSKYLRALDSSSSPGRRRNYTTGAGPTIGTTAATTLSSGAAGGGWGLPTTATSAGAGAGGVGPYGEEKQDQDHHPHVHGHHHHDERQQHEAPADNLDLAIQASEAKLDRLHTIYKTI